MRCANSYAARFGFSFLSVDFFTSTKAAKLPSRSLSPRIRTTPGTDTKHTTNHLCVTYPLTPPTSHFPFPLTN